MIEAWLAAGVFGLLVLMWVFLPHRLVQREREEARGRKARLRH